MCPDVLKFHCARELYSEVRRGWVVTVVEGVVEDVLPLQHFITFSFLATLSELPLPFSAPVGSQRTMRLECPCVCIV